MFPTLDLWIKLKFVFQTYIFTKYNPFVYSYNIGITLNLDSATNFV